MTTEEIADLLRRLAGGDEVALSVDTAGELLSILAKVADAGVVDLRGLPPLTANQRALAGLLAAAKAGGLRLELTVKPRGEVHARAAGFTGEVHIRSDLPRRRGGAFGSGSAEAAGSLTHSKRGPIGDWKSFSDDDDDGARGFGPLSSRKDDEPG